MADNQASDSQICDNQICDNQVSDNEISDNEVSDILQGLIAKLQWICDNNSNNLFKIIEDVKEHSEKCVYSLSKLPMVYPEYDWERRARVVGPLVRKVYGRETLTPKEILKLKDELGLNVFWQMCHSCRKCSTYEKVIHYEGMCCGRYKRETFGVDSEDEKSDEETENSYRDCKGKLWEITVTCETKHTDNWGSPNPVVDLYESVSEQVRCNNEHLLKYWC